MADVFLPITARSKVFGIIGWPVAHSLSPALHNRAFSEVGFPGVYVAFPVPPDRLGQALAGARALGLSGLNVTVPHKAAVIPFLDELTPSARRIGAVNTIVARDGRLVGDNTDGRGFLRAFSERWGNRLEGSRVLLLGAGGSARAIAVELLGAGIRQLDIVNRTFERARDLAEHLDAGSRVAAWSLADPAVKTLVQEADVLIHATSWGMEPHGDVEPLVSEEWLDPHTIVCDIVYVPAETSLLRAARRRGCPVLPGLGMLLYQGALAFESWTGLPAPVPAMQETLEKSLYG